MRGATLDALFAPAHPTPARLKRMHINGARLVAAVDDKFFFYHSYLRASVLETAVVLTLSSFPDGTSSRNLFDQAARYANRLRPRPTFWIVMNEWNIEGAASWPAHDEVARVWNAVYEGLAGSAPIWLGGMFSKENLVDDLKLVLEQLDYPPDGVDLHLYLETAQQAEAIFTEISSFMPVACMEWNDSTPDGVMSYEKILERCTAHSCFLPFDKRQTETEAQPLPGLVSGTHITNLGRAYSAVLA